MIIQWEDNWSEFSVESDRGDFTIQRGACQQRVEYALLLDVATKLNAVVEHWCRGCDTNRTTD